MGSLGNQNTFSASRREQVLAVAVLGQRLGKRLELFGRDPALAEGDFLRAGDLEALALLDGGDELAGFEQAVVGAGVEPGVAAAHDLDVELAFFEVEAVEVGDLEFATRRGLEVARRGQRPGCRRNRGR